MRLITVIGPTACGKTRLAVRLAARLDTDVISADSRQVYRGMDIGTGKDLSEYCFNGTQIPYHLIDIREAGYKYNLYEYQRDFEDVYQTLSKTKQQAILCGGSGLYIDAVIRGYELQEVPQNRSLREELEPRSMQELTDLLASIKPLHNTSDLDTKKRVIRAIEIAQYQSNHTVLKRNEKPDHLYIGIDIPREVRRERIAHRLRQRIDEGLIEEVENLLETVAAEDLIFYGLEYKFVTQYILGKLSKQEMTTQLQSAICQFSKRQMTFFRSMIKKGAAINWIDASRGDEHLFNESIKLINK